MPDVKRVLVIGGCHANGFPLQSGDGYPEVAARLLSQKIAVETKVLGPIKVSAVLKRAAPLIDEFRPDIIVLQLGHFESSLPFKKKWKYSPRTDSEAHTAVRDTIVFPVLALPGLKEVFVNGPLRFLAQAALGAIGRPQFDSHKFEEELTIAFDGLRAMCGESTQFVVILPLASLGAGIARRRKRAAAITRRVAEKFMWRQVDYSTVLKRTGFLNALWGHPLFLDLYHLNYEGNQVLGRLLAIAIDQVLKQKALQIPLANLYCNSTSAPILMAAARTSMNKEVYEPLRV